ncbi:hypothetical protein [Rathayibacter toxicus]|nr:hypothetical protein [Rathayibacter toxicus]QOD08544.1 hypothetical protein AYW78_01300 [Rathayibacter toxicus]QWL25344.1 hypothetical protein E2R32_01290 [Rathayibacter toxicus]QWL31602.1 hypothetical protein E2R35_01205 [Rathayibacter toxicus]QWL33694.1 hypothetical protein E2R36_01205 [Rathayibacter toxicus]QWL35828.1 hypothetical protein E2R37_01205 [Rathayibacter toxicus]
MRPRPPAQLDGRLPDRARARRCDRNPGRVGLTDPTLRHGPLEENPAWRLSYRMLWPQSLVPDSPPRHPFLGHWGAARLGLAAVTVGMCASTPSLLGFHLLSILVGISLAGFGLVLRGVVATIAASAPYSRWAGPH